MSELSLHCHLAGARVGVWTNQDPASLAVTLPSEALSNDSPRVVVAAVRHFPLLMTILVTNIKRFTSAVLHWEKHNPLVPRTGPQISDSWQCKFCFKIDQVLTCKWQGLLAHPTLQTPYLQHPSYLPARVETIAR